MAAVTRQVGTLAHTSNLAIHEPGVRLAERLVELIGVPARVFFANSGAEANECAVKLARRYGWTRNPDGSRLEIVAANGSFHGRTLGALAITGNRGQTGAFRAAARAGDVRGLRRRRCASRPR